MRAGAGAGAALWLSCSFVISIIISHRIVACKRSVSHCSHREIFCAPHTEIISLLCATTKLKRSFLQPPDLDFGDGESHHTGYVQDRLSSHSCGFLCRAPIYSLLCKQQRTKQWWLSFSYDQQLRLYQTTEVLCVRERTQPFYLVGATRSALRIKSCEKENTNTNTNECV